MYLNYVNNYLQLILGNSELTTLGVALLLVMVQDSVLWVFDFFFVIKIRVTESHPITIFVVVSYTQYINRDICI